MTSLLRRCVAVALLSFLLLGVPSFLAWAAGWPVPDVAATFSGATPDTGFSIELLSLACWLAWLDLVVCLFVELWAQVRKTSAPKLTIGGPLQWLAAWMIATAIMGPVRGETSTTVVRMPLETVLAYQEVTLDEVPVVDSRLETQASPPLQQPHQERVTKRITVKPRDSLCGLAKVHLGDELRWREIYDLNKGNLQPDGRRLDDQDLIRPGWIFEIPVDAPTSDASAHEAPEVVVPSSTLPPATTPTTASAPSVEQVEAESSAPVSVELPSGSVVGLSFASGVAAAVGLQRLLRRRHYRPSTPAAGLRRNGSDLEETVDRLVQAATIDDEAVSSKHDGTSAQPLGPAEIEIGKRDQEVIVVDIVETGGIAVDGASSADVIRAVIAALVSSSPLMTTVVVSSSMLKLLVPGLDPFPGLECIDDERSLLARLEAELIARSRLLDHEDVADIQAHRLHHPDDPLPALIAVVDSMTSDQQRRLDAILTLGRRLGISAVCMDVHSAEVSNIAVDVDASVVDVSAALLETLPRGTALFHLTAHEAKDALSALASSRLVTAIHDDIVDGHSNEQESFDTPSAVVGSPIFVCVFGGYDILVRGNRVKRDGRTKSWEVLAFFILHPEGMSLADATKQMWPFANGKQREAWFWSALGPLRTRLRQETGIPELKLIDSDGDLYRIDFRIIDSDLWQFQRALEAVENAKAGSDTRADALQAALDAYSGDLLKQTTYGWIDTARKDARRRGLDVVIELAEISEDAGDLKGAIAMLDRGIERDKFAEELYRRVIDLRRELKQPDAAREVYADLEEALAEIGADPDRLSEQALLRAIGESPSA